jgi:hypothetical protein
VGAVIMIGLALGTQHNTSQLRNPLFYSEIGSSPRMLFLMLFLRCCFLGSVF